LAIRRLSRSGIAAHRRFEGLRFDWRRAPGEDILPRAVRAHGAIIAVVLALWIAMTVAWGWAAGMAFPLRVLMPSPVREDEKAGGSGLNTCSFAGERLFALRRGCAEKWRLRVCSATARPPLPCCRALGLDASVGADGLVRSGAFDLAL
jgi:hypothetical protein